MSVVLLCHRLTRLHFSLIYYYNNICVEYFFFLLKFLIQVRRCLKMWKCGNSSLLKPQLDFFFFFFFNAISGFGGFCTLHFTFKLPPSKTGFKCPSHTFPFMRTADLKPHCSVSARLSPDRFTLCCQTLSLYLPI